MMASNKVLASTGEVVTGLSLTELCSICASSEDWVIELVEEGILEPVGSDRATWKFESASVTVVHKVQRLQGDLSINLAGIAVVLVLADENALLKRRLAQIETGH